MKIAANIRPDLLHVYPMYTLVTFLKFLKFFQGIHKYTYFYQKVYVKVYVKKIFKTLIFRLLLYIYIYHVYLIYIYICFIIIILPFYWVSEHIHLYRVGGLRVKSIHAMQKTYLKDYYSAVYLLFLPWLRQTVGHRNHGSSQIDCKLITSLLSLSYK